MFAGFPAEIERPKPRQALLQQCWKRVQRIDLKVRCSFTDVKDSILPAEPGCGNAERLGATDVCVEGVADVDGTVWADADMGERRLEYFRLRFVTPDLFGGYDSFELQAVTFDLAR